MLGVGNFTYDYIAYKMNFVSVNACDLFINEFTQAGIWSKFGESSFLQFQDNNFNSSDAYPHPGDYFISDFFISPNDPRRL
jgi:hypothetical protein